MSGIKTKTKTPPQKFVVIVQRTELQRDVYGTYSRFLDADKDAQAWGGTVEPVQPPKPH